MVRTALSDSAPLELVEAAELCVSELVTNAVVHAGTLITVAIQHHAGGVRIEVEDGSGHLPVPRNYSTLASTGRGLLMVDQLVTRWGVRSRSESKTVWFELGTASEDRGDDVDDILSPAAPAVSVELCHLPLLIHAAWQMHAESLLREYLLVHLDEDSLRELEAHAAASDAISLLEQQIPPLDLGEDADKVMAGAVEPLVSAERIVISVPLASVPHFAVLDRLLEAATGMADRGELLTPPTQPEIRDFRHWVCREVAEQAGGGAPQAWDSQIRYVTVPVAAPLEWDVTEVTRSAAAVIAADDAGSIVAVSQAAVQALRYAEARQLVGRRLVEVIPERFRQAHLSGVTLHLFAGRGPLLEAPITVPALCADGTEIPVVVTVRSRQLPHGRRLFTAHLEAAAS